MKHTIVFLYTLIFFTSCTKLTDVLDNDPPTSLVPENVVANRQGAYNLLNGAYAILHEQYLYMHTEMVPAVLGGTMRRNTQPDIQFQNNTLIPANAIANSMWQSFYKLINQTNWVIKLSDQLPAGELTDTEQKQMKAEAMALRAMGHFEALRFFGQYYNEASEYGVIVRTIPVDYTTRAIKRSKVADVYQLILSDLDYAIANAPDFTKPIYMSKSSAKALKARVMQYKGDYATAAQLADEVINDGKRVLSSTFAKVFSDGFNSTEMIFMRATNAITAVAERKQYTYSNGAVQTAPWLKTFMTGDPRATITFNATNNYVLKVNNTAAFATTYFIRLVEMYLIKAEGLARGTTATLDEAKAPMLEVKSRAFGTPQVSLATTKAGLLDEIYAEYIKELCFENGSDWFASIRFGKIATAKPTVTSVDQYILPIPETEVLSNNLFGKQNPGYE